MRGRSGESEGHSGTLWAVRGAQTKQAVQFALLFNFLSFPSPAPSSCFSADKSLYILNARVCVCACACVETGHSHAAVGPHTIWLEGEGSPGNRPGFNCTDHSSGHLLRSPERSRVCVQPKKFLLRNDCNFSRAKRRKLPWFTYKQRYDASVDTELLDLQQREKKKTGK